jgi:hypothetical protein
MLIHYKFTTKDIGVNNFKILNILKVVGAIVIAESQPCALVILHFYYHVPILQFSPFQEIRTPKNTVI